MKMNTLRMIISSVFSFNADLKNPSCYSTFSHTFLNYKYALFLLIAMGMFSNVNAQSCTINLSQSKLEFPLSGGSTQIDVSPAGTPSSGCSNPTLTVYNVPSWLNVSVIGGTIYVFTNSSISSGYREASIPVQVNGITLNGFSVIQGTKPIVPPVPCSVSGFGEPYSLFAIGGEIKTFPLTFSNCTQNSATFSFTRDGDRLVPNWIIISQTGSSISVRTTANTGPGRTVIIVGKATIGGKAVAIGTQISQNSCYTNWYVDNDGDGFGDPNNVTQACSAPDDGLVYVSNNQDCDDTRDYINPNTKWYSDDDGDGFGAHDGEIFIGCSQPTGYSDNNDDWCPGVVGLDYGCPNQTVVYDENYIHTILPQIPIKNLLNRSNNDDFIESINYFDGLGRPKQTILKQGGGVRQDIITPIVYDAYGRQTKEYLPYANSTPTTPSLVYRDNNTLLQKLTNYYATNYSEDINLSNPNPYSEKELEASPLNRVLKQAAPGDDWRIGGGHDIEFNYEANTTEDQVRVFTASLNSSYVPSLVGSGSNYYDPGELYKTITRDENHSGITKNHTTEAFKNKQGQIVLKRTYADIDLNDDGDTGDIGEQELEHDTYYVYDKFGNLSYVIPPKVTTDNVSATELNELCYQYKYDSRNRLIEKKIPGKGNATTREEIVYNNLDQPVLTRDPNLKNNDQWLFTKYDVFGRVAYTGILNSNATRNTLQTNANVVNTAWVTKGNEISLGGTKISYDDGGYPDGNAGTIEILTVNYYDNHTFNTAGLTVPTGSVYDQNIVTGLGLKGLATGSKVKVLVTTAPYWITSITIYDKKGRPISIASKNEYLNTIDIVQTNYDFVGKVLKTRTRHQKDSNDEIVTLDVFEYDHMGRLISQRQCIGDDALPDDCNNGIGNENPVFNSVVTSSQNEVANGSITLSPGFHVVATASLSFSASITPRNNTGELIVKNHYDELGQLDRKNVGGTSEEGFQTVDYTYNIRGWLKGINNEAGSNASIALETSDLFGFQINYNNPIDPSKALFNGNISQTLWKTTNEDKSLKSYTYTYDALNRIISGIDNANHYNLSNLTYDKNGNILSLTRGGHLVEEPDPEITSHWGNMDVLTYSYQANSNKLQKVTDSALNTSGNGEFIDGNTSGNDYIYDANGNMVVDLNKGIGTTTTSRISYNHLNLPDKVTVNDGVTNNGNITYIYDATGVKLKKIVSTGATTEYAGNYVYENGSLKFFNHPEGYFDVTSPPLEELEGDYVYQYKDHLGNIRLSYKDNEGSLEILEENNYYPFGLKHKGYNNNPVTNYPYKYNGVELNESLGLNLYEMDFRQYDPAIGRFNVIDEMAEDATDYTPYRFGFNNPIYFSDPTGLWEEVAGGYSTNDEDEIARLYGYLNHRGNTDASVKGIKGFIKEDIAYMKDFDDGLQLSTARMDNKGLTGHSVHRIQNEVAYYQRKTDYLYTREDYEMRNKILAGGTSDPISRELLRRERTGRFQPITARNYIDYVGGELTARLLTYKSFSNMMDIGPGPKSIGRSVTPKYLGKRTNRGTIANKNGKVSILGSNQSSNSSNPRNMSWSQFRQQYSHLYRGQFRGRGTYLKHMSMDFQRLKKGL